MRRAARLLLCAVLSLAGCRCQRPEKGPPEGGIPPEAGPVLAPSGPAAPFLRVLDVGGVLDAHHQVWLWPAPFGLTHAVRVTGLEDVQNVMGLDPWLCALLGTERFVVSSVPSPRRSSPHSRLAPRTPDRAARRTASFFQVWTGNFGRSMEIVSSGWTRQSGAGGPWRRTSRNMSWCRCSASQTSHMSSVRVRCITTVASRAGATRRSTTRTFACVD
jgi:hypothetical protein